MINIFLYFTHTHIYVLVLKKSSISTVKHVNKISKHRQSLYSIEFGPSLESLRSRADTILDYDNHLDEREVGELSPKPMTPRRVKRRSVMARGSNSRHSTTSRRGQASGSGSRTDLSAPSGSGTNSRSSSRSSRRKYQQNPVTKLLDQQQKQLQQQQHHTQQHMQTTKQNFGSFHRNKDNYGLTESNLQTLNNEIINRSIGNKSLAGSVAGSLSKTNNNNNNNYQGYRKNILPDPIYYNTNAQTGLYQQAWESHSQSPIVVNEDPPSSPTLPPPVGPGGHFNPTYQHSTTNLHDAEHVDEVYNNRPPSVHSSYSNFHGTRPLSSYLPNINNNNNNHNKHNNKNNINNNNNVSENVFVGLSGASQHQQQHLQVTNDMHYQLQHVPPSTPPLYQQHPLHQPIPPPPPPIISTSISQQHLAPYPPTRNYPNTAGPQNIPFNKQRTASRESIRSMAFLNNGPPAYNLNYHTPPDSETTM